MCGLLIITLFFQFKSKKYEPSIYWLAVVLISVFGTLITDNLVDNFGVSLITTTKREAFYMFAILFTFALGTAAGDLMAEGLGLGYSNSAAMFAVMIGVVAIAFYRLKLNPVVAFWIAYILTVILVKTSQR